MTKIIAVTGATGAQGGGVVNVLLKTPGWKVRAITRNTTSEKAKDLASRGAEVVQGNIDDESSLAKAFEGASAIFAVTNFWEHLMTGKSQDESGAAEEEQGMKLARSAAKVSSLEHYIWSTLPNAKKMTNGKAPVAHLDYKAQVDERIRKELPELARKTTYLFFGYYPNNMAFLPLTKPLEYPGAYGKYVQVLPTPASAVIPVSGDMTVTPGIWVRQILANPSKAFGKYANVAPEVLTFGEMLKQWGEVTGRATVYLEIPKSQYGELWGVAGNELADQLLFGELVSNWEAGYDVVSKKELGITDIDKIGLKAALGALKTTL